MGVERKRFQHYNDVVYIKKSVLNEMIAHCKEELPFEACGLLSGTCNRVETLWEIQNVEKSSTSFAMDMTQAGYAVEMMRKNREFMTGIYHSHPTGKPFPSKDDILNAHYPEVAYFIISLASEEAVLRCYRIIKHKVRQLKIEVIG